MKPNIYTIHIFQTSNSKEFLDKKLGFVPVCPAYCSLICYSFLMWGAKSLEGEQAIQTLASEIVIFHGQLEVLLHTPNILCK